MTEVFPSGLFLHEIKVNRNVEGVLGKTYEFRACPEIDNLMLHLTPLEYKDGYLECDLEMVMIEQPTKEVAQQ